MNSSNSEKYLSLKTAAQLYGYTRDHLGLMIRRSKLKGIKLGSYYVTTNKWMTEYIKKYADPDHPINKAKLSNKFLAEAIKGQLSDKVISRKAAVFKVSAGKNPAQNSETDLQKKIIEELRRFDVGVSDRSQKTDDLPRKMPTPSLPENSYVILPIRKMENFERDNILNRL